MGAEKRSSFYWPMQCMNAQKREAMRALYAFCRAVDDVADGAQPVAQKERALAQWREELDLLFAGRPAHRITQMLLKTPMHHPEDCVYFHGIIDGVAMDVAGHMLKPSLEDLWRYCDGVAGCVGMLSLKIMEVDREPFAAFAEALGRALQLTNILRDISVDAAMGRIYLPREWLEEAGLDTVTPDQIVTGSVDLARVRNRLSEEAARYYHYVHAYPMTRQQRWKLLPALLMCDVYEHKWKGLRGDAKNYSKNSGMRLKDQAMLLMSLLARVITCLLPGESAQSHKADSPHPARLRP